MSAISGQPPDRTRFATVRSGTRPRSSVASAAPPATLGPFYACDECFGPLEIGYDFPAVTREEIEAGPKNIWRYQPLLPVPDRHHLQPEHGARLHPAGQGRQPRPRARPAQPVRQGRLRQPDALVQGPRRRDRALRRPRARRQGLRLPVDRQPRQRGRRRRCPRRHPHGRLHPARPRAGQDPDDRGVRRLAGRRPRLVRRRQPARLGDRRRGGGLGVRQRQRPALLRRGLQDAGVRDRRAARLAASPSRSSSRWRAARS